MSPASSGPLEVERYIGACLISSQQSRHKKGHYHQQQQQQQGHHGHQRQPGVVHHHPHHHHQQHQHQHPDGGAYNGYRRLQRCDADGRCWPAAGNGGVPLLYNPHYGPRGASEHLTRLAVQTQGIPLILSNKYHNRRNKHRNGGGYVNPAPSATANAPAKDVNKGVGQCTDTVSIASDESCASNASDTCLPRIIKPRKRRKKDRKPQHHPRALQVGAGDSAYSSAQDTSSPEIDYSLPFNYYAFDGDQRQRVLREEKNEAPKLSHLFEDVCDDLDATDLNGNETSCQCRYCDPSGQIWDMDVDYLASSSPLSLSFGSGSGPGSGSSPGDFDRAPSRPRLRRHSSDAQSLLESLSTISLDDDSTSSSMSSSSSSSYSSSAPTALSSAPNSPNLEVSTEIVTSHNGHRDLEIKFFSIFSASSTSASSERDRSDKSVCGDAWTGNARDVSLSDEPEDRDEQCAKS